MRLFFAIELPDGIRGRLAHVQDRWAAPDEHKVSWTKPENLHITVKFLGDVDDPALAKLLVAMKSLPASGPIELRTEAMEYFPNRGPIRIIAVQVGGDVGRLQRIYDALEGICEGQGFKREGRAYRPHITIGRSRDGLPGHLRHGHREKRWPEPSPFFIVNEIALMESHLEAGGSRYVKLAGFPV
jgi:2'-5' RNA ligase